MELMPIIKMSFYLFAAVTFVIVVSSYIFYKFKQKVELQGAGIKKMQVEHSFEINRKPIQDFEKHPIISNRTQEFYIPQRNTQSKKIKSEPTFQRERFVVMNNQQEFRTIETAKDSYRAFYYPQNYNSSGNSFGRNTNSRFA